MPAGFHHVEVYVSDLAASVTFWDWLLMELGFDQHQQWPKGKSWRCGSHYLVLVQADERYLRAGFHRKRVGLNHLAFWAPSPAAFESLLGGFHARGIRLLYQDRYENPAVDEGVVFFEDPDRIKVEVVRPAQ